LIVHQGVRPRSGEPRYFGPRPDSVVVPLALRWAAFFVGRLSPLF
jgi:hypothetical protein